ncbi:glutathione S-transferase family protein [uncultured Roseibium sp.]|uniref:glutathione S-transferase family protein n=1 Tax=uncultured Roseibium sp. TaxID=1936171 RepID=UPI002624A0C8|nr:glutathione S-transferase family protein [uncultured Roseibium sp.]
MKLYVTDLSPNSRRVIAAVGHLGFDGETEIQKYDLIKGEHRSDELKAVNPNQKVPVLVDGDFSLWEANPIMIYLGERAGDEAFCPTDRRGRIEVVRWMSWEVQHFNRALGDIVWETVAKQVFGFGAPDTAKIEAGQENFRRFAEVLENHLADRNFVLGDDLTIADFAVGSHSALAMHPQSQVPLEEFTRVNAYLERLEAVPAWAATAPKPRAEAAE